MPAATPYLQRVSELLARVLALTDKVISERVTWKASAAEWDFLLEVSSLTERVLPAEAATRSKYGPRLSVARTLQS